MELQFTTALDHPELMPASVFNFIKSFDTDHEIQIAEINPAYADGQLLHEYYGVPYEMELNCLIVEGTRGEETQYAALVVPYGKRAATNATTKKPLDVKKVSFANLEEVVKQTQMEYGSITPVGLPDDWKILLDSQIFDQSELIIGGGLVHSKIKLPSYLLKELPNAIVVEGLAKDKKSE